MSSKSFVNSDKKDLKSASFGKKKNNKSTKSKEVNVDEYSFAGLKYRLPGKNQRIIIGSLVIGLNILFLVAIILYFKVPEFQDFVYNVGRST